MVSNLPEPNIPDRWDETERVEMDLSKQLLFLVKGGDVQAILPISSGGNYTYWSERNQKDVRAGTPRGDFTLNWYRKGWREDSTTGWWLYNYWAFTPFYGLHGYRSVPNYPASHGCTRVNLWNADWLESQLFVGMPVHIWDRPPDYPPEPPSPMAGLRIGERAVVA